MKGINYAINQTVKIPNLIPTSTDFTSKNEITMPDYLFENN